MQGLRITRRWTRLNSIAAARAGEFAFHWQAHGLAYGIPRAALAPLNEGRTLIFNGSRRSARSRAGA